MSNIEKPDHYQLEGLEPYESIDVIRAVLGDRVKYFYIGNILKYIIRAEKKNGLEDYKKAEVYLEWLIEWESLKGSANEMSYEELNIEFINSKITEIQNDINKHCMNKILDKVTAELLCKIFDGIEELRVKEVESFIREQESCK